MEKENENQSEFNDNDYTHMMIKNPTYEVGHDHEDGTIILHSHFTTQKLGIHGMSEEEEHDELIVIPMDMMEDVLQQIMLSLGCLVVNGKTGKDENGPHSDPSNN